MSSTKHGELPPNSGLCKFRIRKWHRKNKLDWLQSVASIFFFFEKIKAGGLSYAQVDSSLLLQEKLVSRGIYQLLKVWFWAMGCERLFLLLLQRLWPNNGLHQFGLTLGKMNFLFIR